MKKISVLVTAFFLLTLCGCSSKDIKTQTTSGLKYDRNEQQLQNDKLTLDTENSDCDDPYLAAIGTEDLQSEPEPCSSYANCSITFDFEDRSKKVDSYMIADWIIMLPDGSVMKDSNGDPVFDREKVAAFVEQMAAETDTFGTSRSFYATVDGWITVPWNYDYSCIYGWQINQAETVEKLIGLMCAGETVTVEPEYNIRGCVSLTILLNHLGFSVNKMTLARSYLPKLDFYWSNGVYYGADFRYTFAGNPESANSYGCYAPCIATTADRYFSANGFKGKAYNITGMPFDSLLNEYIRDDIPVLIWITSSNLHETQLTSIWTTPSGEKVQWLAYEHCVVLTGYDKTKNLVYVSDPLMGNVSYDYSRIKQRYIDMGEQSICIKNDELFLNDKLLISGTSWHTEDGDTVEKALEFAKDGFSGYYIICPENNVTMNAKKIPFIYETKGDEITLHIADSSNSIVKTKLIKTESEYILPFEWHDGHTENFRTLI